MKDVMQGYYCPFVQWNKNYVTFQAFLFSHSAYVNNNIILEDYIG